MDLNCQPHSWHTQGVRDGAHGAPLKAADEYERVCSNQSTAFDRQAYENGLHEGHRDYCTGQNGFELGLSGQSAEKVCPSELTQVFRESYLTGRTLRRAVRNLDHAISHGEPSFTGIATAQAQYYRVSQELANNSGTDDRSQELRSKRSELTSQIRNGQAERVTDLRRVSSLAIRCEKAKQRAEAMGYHPDVNCI